MLARVCWDLDKKSSEQNDEWIKDQNRTGVTVFSFGNARVNYEDSSVTTAIYLSNYAKPRPKLMTKKYNRKIS